MKVRTGDETLLVTLFVAVFAILLVRTAWISDDAYITFRVADNLLAGYGLRWNVAERVQAFTNPLWLALMAGLSSVTKDVYYTSLALSIGLSVSAALLVALRVAASVEHALLAIAMLSLSKAFVDYSTSGLENPLTHLLLVLLGVVVLGGETRRRTLLQLGLLAGAAALNRMDSLLLFFPALLATAVQARTRRATGGLLLGFAPFVLWVAFAFFYYGFPFPNTAYAKLTTGIPERELLAQGIGYLLNSLSADPLTLLVILLGLAAPLVLGVREGWPLAAGIGLHLAYTVWVGGDFMSGRFLAAPFLLAVLLVARARATLSEPRLVVALAAVALVGLSAPHANVFSDAGYFADRQQRRDEMIDDRGISDERAVYYRGTGLLTVRRDAPMPNHYMAEAGRKARAEGETFVVRGAVGMFGFFAGPGVHIIDPVGLGDAFLARLPAKSGWRVGHFARALPQGYQAAVRKDRPHLEDPDLTVYYKKLHLVTRGDLFDLDRWRAIWDLNVGGAGRLLEAYCRIHSRMQRLSLDDVREPAEHPFSDHGIEVTLGAPRNAGEIEIGLDANDYYVVQFLRGSYVLSEQRVSPKPAGPGGFAIHRLTVDPRVAASGYDRVRIFPQRGDDAYSLGHLRLIEKEGD